MPTERDCARHLSRVRSNLRLGLQETIALGLLVARKWDRAGHAVDEPTAQDAVEHDNFTTDEIDEFRANASRTLVEYAASLPSPDCSGAQPSWWYGVSQGLAAAFFYSVILVVVGISVKLFGSDLITVLRSLIGPS